ncbi:MAG: transglutaminase-like domain-containing protein, partial [Ilumatobacteraceae bacterium]
IKADLESSLYRYDAKARPGHNLGVLTDFLTAASGGNGVESSRVGYAEQFAAAFAALARIEGMPSRVVVGYKLDDATAAAAAAGTEVQVLPKMVHAWAEVNLNGVGWVTFDPTTQAHPAPPEETPPTVTTIAPADSTTPSSSPATTNPSATTVPANGPGGKRSGGGGVPGELIVLLGVLVLIPALMMLARRGVRQQRHTRGSPADRTMGAWHEARDGLRTYGHPVLRAETVGELVERTETDDPELAAGLRELKPLVDVALFAPSDPPDDLAEAAWAAEASVGRSLAQRASFIRRVRAAVDPRPLVDHFRRR